MCMVVLDRHLVVCVGYMFVCVVLVFSACCTVVSAVTAQYELIRIWAWVGIG